MKRKIAALLAAVLCIPVFSGCSEEAEQTSSEKKVRISSSPIDPEIIGTWKNETNGYIFQENRQVSLPIDFTSSAHFNSDGTFSMESTTVEKDRIDYDGTELTVSQIYDEIEDENNELVLLEMKRKGASAPDSLDGVYDLTGGSYAEMIAYNFGMSIDQLDLEAEIDGDSFYITIVDYCYYETLGSSLELFSENMEYVDESASAVKYEYKIDGDTLTLTYATGEQEVFTRTDN